MEIYLKIKEQRDSINAPVDYIGCHSMGKNQEENIRKFQILIGLLLSSQTKDEVTFKAIENLNKKLGILSPTAVLNSDREEVHECINKVGYHNKKTGFLYEICKRVVNGMPDSLEETLALPGIGKKMAYLYLAHAHNRNEGIGVDTHVHRISNRIGLVKTKNEEGTRIELEKLFEKEEWQVINKVFVGFGQTICLPTRPKCELCKSSDLCPFYTNKQGNSKRK